MKIYHENGRIYFNSDKANKLGITEFDDGLWTKINSTKWHVMNKRYINSTKLGALHRLVMAHWYGQEALYQANKMNYVVDHMNNDGFDCRVSNLCFIPKDRNTAKGQTFDKKRKEVVDKLALSIFKDFSTQLFQITIAFNQPTILKLEDEFKDIVTLKLLYEDDFERTLFDAEKILHEYTKYGKFDLKKLNNIDNLIEVAEYLQVSEEERQSPIIIRDGKAMLNLNSEHVRLTEIAPDENMYKNSSLKDKS